MILFLIFPKYLCKADERYHENYLLVEVITSFLLVSFNFCPTDWLHQRTLSYFLLPPLTASLILKVIVLYLCHYFSYIVTWVLCAVNIICIIVHISFRFKRIQHIPLIFLLWLFQFWFKFFASCFLLAEFVIKDLCVFVLGKAVGC